MKTVVLLVIANVFMTLAWYAHLKFNLVSYAFLVGAVYFAFLK